MILLPPSLTAHSHIKEVDIGLYSELGEVVNLSVDKGGLTFAENGFTMTAGEKKTVKCYIHDTGKTYTVSTPATVGFSDPTLNTGLLESFPFDDNTDSTVIAGALGNIDGVCNVNTDTISVSGGMFGNNRIEFIDNYKYVDFPDLIPYIEAGKKISIEASWWRTYGEIYGNLLGDIRVGSGANSGFSLRSIYDAVYAYASDGTGNYNRMQGNNHIVYGRNHVLFTYNGNTDPNGFLTGSKIYVNGAADLPNNVYNVGTISEFAPINVCTGKTKYKQGFIRIWADEVITPEQYTSLFNDWLHMEYSAGVGASMTITSEPQCTLSRTLQDVITEISNAVQTVEPLVNPEIRFNSQEDLREEITGSYEDRVFNIPLIAGGNGNFIGNTTATLALQIIYTKGIQSSDVDLIKQKLLSQQWTNGIISVDFESFSVDYQEEMQVSILLMSLNVEYRAT